MTSAGVGPIANINDAPAGAATIVGTVAEDQVLTADTSGITDADGLGTFSYQWYRDGSAITGATAATYTTGDADVGTQLGVEASYTDAHGTGEAVMSAQTAAVSNVNDAPTGSVVIDNLTPDQGDVLTASHTLADADGLSGPISFQWFRDGTAIAGATGTSYTTAAADVGAALTVVASYTDDQGTAESVSSAPTSLVNAPVIEDETIVPPDEETTEPPDDSTPDTEPEETDPDLRAATELFMHHQKDDIDGHAGIEYAVDDYEFGDYDYRDDHGQRFSLTAPFKQVMDKVVDAAVDVAQLMDLIRIQVNEQAQQTEQVHIRVIGGITLSLSAGLATLLTRSSAIAAGLMSSVSVMNGFDPLMAMKNAKRGKGDEEGAELDEQVDKLFDESDDNNKSDDKA